MPNVVFSKKTLPEISKLLRSRELLFKDLTELVVENINQSEEKIGAYLTLTMEKALKDAEELDKKKEIPDNYLYGIPISVKDTFTTKDVRTTAGSKMLENFIPPYDATSYKRLKESGTILLGKTNMDEFAHGFTTEYSAFKITRNPWNLNKVPGGSSGGSAASIAAGLALLSLASENFGSIIQPAALCGIVGMKPTYGRASRYGIIAMASSLECPGVMGRCVEDVAIGIEAICGWDKHDATTTDVKKEYFYKNLTKEIKGKKIAVIKPIIERLQNNETAIAGQEATALFEKLGAKIKYIDWYDQSIDGKIYDVLYRAEVSSNLSRYDGIRYGYLDLNKKPTLDEYYQSNRDKFGKHVKRQIITDPITLEAEDENVYLDALKLRRKNANYIDSLFNDFDAIVTPACLLVDLDIGSAANPVWRNANRHLSEINALMVCPTALYGYPAITYPIGFSKSGMPIGINMFSARFNEQALFDLAYSFQEESGLKFLQPTT